MARELRLRPNELVSPWPHGETSDPAGSVAATFARALSQAVDGRGSRRAFSRTAAQRAARRNIIGSSQAALLRDALLITVR